MLYQLSYAHHIICLIPAALARPAGLEPATIRLEGGCSIQLSYGRLCGSNPWFRFKQHRATLVAFSTARQARRILDPNHRAVNIFLKNFKHICTNIPTAPQRLYRCRHAMRECSTPS